jgi:sulfite reductase alpha subunit-like flavoprotein
MVLIFGCRSQNTDNYYSQDWIDLKAASVNLSVITAFSRDTEDGSKEYVQHKIKSESHSMDLANLIFKGEANIRVSGRAKYMPASVEKAFALVLEKHCLEGREGAGAEYIKNMRKTGRYQQEVW